MGFEGCAGCSFSSKICVFRLAGMMDFVVSVWAFVETWGVGTKTSKMWVGDRGMGRRMWVSAKTRDQT